MPEKDAKDQSKHSKADEKTESQEDTNTSTSESDTTDTTSQEDGKDQSQQSDESKTQGAEDDEDNTDSKESKDDADSKESKDDKADDKKDADESEDDDDDAFVPLAKLRKVRNEAKNLRDRLKTAEARIKELEAGGTNTDAQRQVEDITNELRQERLNARIAQEAVKIGAIEPSAVAKLIDLKNVTWENNAPTNVDAVLKQAKEDYPKLFTPVQGSGNLGSRNERGGNDETVSPSGRLRNAYSTK